jgi:uncharacterized Zn finger protein (UPF0148 family)
MTVEADFVNADNQPANSGQTIAELRQYFCPHCRAPLIRGNIKRLRMECPYCQEMINAPEKDLLKK